MPLFPPLDRKGVLQIKAEHMVCCFPICEREVFSVFCFGVLVVVGILLLLFVCLFLNQQNQTYVVPTEVWIKESRAKAEVYEDA